MLQVQNGRIIIPEEAVLISKTDLHGTLTHVSPDFVEVSGYGNAEEMVGQPHNIIRHPDVPKQVFADLWQTIKAGLDWNAIVKNRSKSGDAYWVEANTSPIYEAGKLVGYVSVRTPASEAQIQQATQLYADIEAGKAKLVNGYPIYGANSLLNWINPIVWMQKFSIAGKFFMATLPPLLVAVILAGWFIKDAYQTQHNMQEMKVYTEFAAIYSLWVHESQKERGMTAGYLGSKGEKFKTQLPDERRLFDARRADFERFVKEHQLQKSDLIGEQVKAILNQLNQLEPTRKAVDNLQIAVPKALSFYTSLNAKMLDSVASLSKISKDPQLSNDLFAYSSFLQSKERAGIERAVLTNTFAQDKFAPGFYERFLGLVSEQNTYMQNFKSHATPDNLAVYDRAIKDESFNKVEEMRAVAKERNLTGGFGINAQDWFDTITAKINQLKVVDDALADALNLKILQAYQKAQSVFWILTGLVTILIVSILIFVFIGFKSIKDPLAKMRCFMESGRLDMRIKMPLSHDETYKIALAFNHLMNMSQYAINSINESVKSLASGNFDAKVEYEIGAEMDRLKDSMNASLETVSSAIQHLEVGLLHLSKGEFNVDLKIPDHFSGQFQELLQLEKNTLLQVNQAITEINQVAKQMSLGQFNKPIQAEMTGELNLLKTNLNMALTQVNQSIESIFKSVQAQSEGDLTQQVKGDFKGRLADLQKGMNESLNNVNTLINEANQLSGIVSQSASKIAANSHDLMARSQQQANILQDTALAVSDITKVVTQTAQNSQEANDLTNQTVTASQSGIEVMQRTTQAMESIKQASAQINDIVNLIDGIAFQTNLLALNAAVEAARAGEHGRGFAVVAGEVRNLAQKSAEAAKDIKSLIQNTTEQIHSGTELVHQTNDSFNEINQNINQVGTLIAQMSLALNQQSQEISQVNKTIARIDQETQQSTHIVAEASEDAESMSQQAQDFAGVMAKFKV
ncbi:nitrate- and nitrite sensing domain-containing protein [Thiosulfativibrio zosterae]|uniref:Methyl-accepting chemotaxis protein n=1 Tax=Thiosulfativibrio zosterae TaxID=2675053 RepID=A0A6F8PNW2_9GAMM|nr:nitrate- and nitrite sensing domain-containing protein [Thiosulfativibrio zosterae]BBP43734.1 hypothetical protein THMIRHAT_14800 [Thiosulfativibrio zosterae]